jgi:glycyl-tRNA synthetase beta subunit
MVMDKDEKLRRNRLALLSMTAAILMELGDPMKVAAAQ